MLAIFTCRIDRRKQRGMKNWEEKHVAHVNAWNLRANNIVFGGPVHRDSQFKTYLEWLKQQTTLKLKVAMDATNIEDLPSDPEDVFDEYDAHRVTPDYVADQTCLRPNIGQLVMASIVHSLKDTTT